MKHNNEKGGAFARPAILPPNAHALASLNETLLRFAKGEHVGPLPMNVKSYMRSQQFVSMVRRSHGDQA